MLVVFCREDWSLHLLRARRNVSGSFKNPCLRQEYWVQFLHLAKGSLPDSLSALASGKFSDFASSFVFADWHNARFSSSSFFFPSLGS